MKSITQFEITWTFDCDYPAGQFANGDWWVVGPVRITGITPPCAVWNGRVLNGSMVNPVAGFKAQGYDSGMPHVGYDAQLNVARGISTTTPLILGTGSSLISSISVVSLTDQSKTTLERAAVLTVLGANPLGGSFRPPYCGSDKTVRFRRANLDTSLLQRLPLLPSTPSLQSVAEWFAAPWLDHRAGWSCGQMHPRRNMPDYGREMHTQIGTAALLLHQDFPPEQKETLLIRFVQLGIDLYGVLVNGGRINWENDGGNGGGRKWPILFAGLLLGDKDMQAVGAKSGAYLNTNGHGPMKEPPDYWHFGEDDQTFYVAQRDVDATRHARWKPDARDAQKIPYEESDIGMPEWGIRHATDLYESNKWLPTYYRGVAGPPFHGTALAALLTPGGKALWNHDAYFDYTDRYMKMTAAGGEYAGWWRSMSPYTAAMWDAYRVQCGPVWPEKLPEPVPEPIPEPEPVPTPESPPAFVAVHRFRNLWNGSYLYTHDETEQQQCLDRPEIWEAQGIAFRALPGQ
jgi:hypothetical protein